MIVAGINMIRVIQTRFMQYSYAEEKIVRVKNKRRIKIVILAFVFLIVLWIIGSYIVHFMENGSEVLPFIGPV